MTNFPTLYEGWVQDILGEAVCSNGVYDESIARNQIDKIKVFDTFVLIFLRNGYQEKRLF